MAKKVICWGAGKLADIAIPQIVDLYDIEYIVDNRKDKEEICGYKICSPEVLIKNKDLVDYVFITAWAYCFEIYRECIILGVDEARIKYWDTELGHPVDFGEMYSLNIHSGNGEELYLKDIFANKDKGIYVDVGAFHPLRVSNTLWAYQRGWRGINIDPNTDNMRFFNMLRPDDTNINCGVSDVEGEITYYKLDDGAYNTFDYQLLVRHKLIDRIVSEEMVPVRRLSDILKENNITEIDFLDIDVEGHEMNVLRGIDFSVEIKIILLEQLRMTLPEVLQSAPYLYLKERGYEAVAKYGETVIYKKLD